MIILIGGYFLESLYFVGEVRPKRVSTCPVARITGYKSNLNYSSINKKRGGKISQLVTLLVVKVS